MPHTQAKGGSIDGRRSAADARLRRESIIEAALACLTHHGYEHSTVAKIGEWAGASTGSLYHFFPGGKPAIAAAVHVDAQVRYQREFLPVLDGASAEHGIRRGVEFHLRWVREHPDRARFLFSDHPVEVRRLVDPELRSHNRAFFRRVTSWIDDHVASGDLRLMPLMVFISIWVGPAHHLARLGLLEGVEAPPDVSAIVDAAWRSLSARGDHA